MSEKEEKKIDKNSEDNDAKLTTKTDIKSGQKIDDVDETKGKENEDKSKMDEMSGKSEIQMQSETGEDGATKSDDNEASSKDEIAKQKKMPKAIFFILGNEFCERFSFYGMRTILTLYLIQELNYSDNGAAKIYHSFKMTAYFMPLLGAILADSWLGRFWTILYISIVYAFGNIITAAGSIPEKLSVMKAVSLTGLFTVAIGTGGIKPCVSAFGGDQFKSDQVEERQKFFSMFYFVINGGSLFSTALTPVLRGDVRCFGQDSCFPLAFFIPAVLFLVALALFIIGKPLYVIKPPEGSVYISFFKCIGHALMRKITIKGEKKQHWLDYANDKYNMDLIHDIKRLFRVLFIYIPLPLFWALFEQQGSKWVLQASKMDNKVFVFYIKPDHMQLVNPLLILILIPIFQNIIYPLLHKLKLCRKPLQRMTVGGLLAAVAFILAGFLQLRIEAELPIPPPKGRSELMIINNSPCNLEISGISNVSLHKFANVAIKSNVMGQEVTWKFAPSGCSATTIVNKTSSAASEYESMMVSLLNNDLQIDLSNDSRIKSKTGEPRMRLLFATEFEFSKYANASFLLEGKSNIYLYPDNIEHAGKAGMTDYRIVKAGKYKMHMPFNRTSHEEASIGEVELKSGGSYIVYVYRNVSESLEILKSVETVQHNSVHILFQVPQGIIITAGEVMFSITGLEFSYSQAPLSMKSVVQAAWLLTNAIGNLLVVVLAHFLVFEKQSNEFFMYAGLMILSMATFGVLAYFYKYIEAEEKD
ncbi:Solute carrier family 15 member 2 like protein [Argiope bruennichi]|uniref:Oligopeptide transporter 1 n=1 Tax=Argiope bruennichi TaxID=94029 RepID=A0A8T0FA17_ARGBR|nr:Solute carrier family 15 member 2 like protein [Argiope bruennichi]